MRRDSWTIIYQILRAMKDTEITQSKLIKATGFNRSTIKYYEDYLLAKDLIEYGNEYYTLTLKGQAVLVKLSGILDPDSVFETSRNRRLFHYGT